MAVNYNLFSDKFPVLYQNRHCYQKDQSIFVCRRNTGYGFDKLIELEGLKSDNFQEMPFLEEKSLKRP